MGLTIGLCYDLKTEYLNKGLTATEVMEFEEEETIIQLENVLGNLGHQTERIGNGKQLAQRLSQGDRWDLVFNLAEGVKGRSREAQVPAICELFSQPYTFSDPLACALTLDKALAKQVIRDCGLPTPSFATVSTPTEVAAISLPVPLFIKPVAEGSSKGIVGHSLVKEHQELLAKCQTLWEKFNQPVLVETFLPGKEITVGIVGNGSMAKVVGAMEVIFTDRAEIAAYTTLNKAEYLERVSYSLLSPKEPLFAEAQELALGAYRAFGCRDTARVDLRADAEGKLQFLEINPLPGLHQINSDLPIMIHLAQQDYSQLINAIIEAAWQRYNS